MWLLKDSSGKPLYLKPNEIFSVGRKKGSLVLADDSVSRHHAEILVIPQAPVDQSQNDPGPSSICRIKDPGSKYGSYIIRGTDPEFVVPKDGQSLKHMDKIRFGVQQSIYTVIYVAVITTTSALDNDEKAELRSVMAKVDGRITGGWETACTHMTVSKRNISEKLTCAIAFGTPIVPMDYWKCVIKAFNANEELPDPLQFSKVVEDKLQLLGDISIKPDPRRRTLFKDLTFVHFDSNQYNLHRRIIDLAGGKSILYRNRPEKNMNLCANDIIVLQLVESNTTQATGTGDVHYAATCEQLGKCRRRAIPTGEIALAILHCSTDKYCNPRHDHAEMFKKKPTNPVEKSNVLALDTQDVDYNLPGTSTGRRPPNINKLDPSKGYVKESVEYETRNDLDCEFVENIMDEASKSLAGKEANNVSRIKDSSRNRADDAMSIPPLETEGESVKIATLNYERYESQETNPEKATNGNPVKRNREDDDDSNISKKKKIIESPRQNGPEKNKDDEYLSDLDVYFDDDMEFGDEKPTIQDKQTTEICDSKPLAVEQLGTKEIEKNGKPTPAGETMVRNPWASQGAPLLVRTTESLSSRRNTDEDETGRKRKAVVLEPPTSWHDPVSPLKRNKTARSSPKKMSKLPHRPEPGQSTMTKFLSPKKNTIAKENTSSIQSAQKCRGVFADSINRSSNNENKWLMNQSSNGTEQSRKSADLDKSSPSLLRINVSKDSFVSPKFGKRFRKVYTMQPRRVELVDYKN